MHKSAEATRAIGLGARFGAFVAERYPFATRAALEAWEAVGGTDRSAGALEALRPVLRRELSRRLDIALPAGLAHTTPRVTADQRLREATDELLDACDGFLRREAIVASVTPAERIETLRGMVLARATDNRLKVFFTGGQVRFQGSSFQGKGFRSLGQEAIYAACLRLKRGEAFRGPDGAWNGDVISPMIRDLGAVLAMRCVPEAVRMALSAQMAKAGPPMDGKDIHISDFGWGVLAPQAPLAAGALTIAGMALAFHLDGSRRVGISFCGEGATSLGEWHEAVNLAAVRRLPAVFCVQNNQTALSTPVPDQSGVRVFADKASGYGIPGITVDGTEPDELTGAFGWAVERAREGAGPTLIEVVAMRMAGHAHHDDMLYLGRDPQVGWEYPTVTGDGYANRELYAYWRERDPIPRYAERLEREGIIGPGDLDRFKREALELVEEQAQLVIDAPWPPPEEAGMRVVAGEPPRRRVEVITEERLNVPISVPLPPLDPGPPVDRKGGTFLDAVMMGLRDALRADPRAFIYGEDVGRTYGNAFLLLRPLLAEFGDRILNSPLSEGSILGASIGAALAGRRPIAEMQFNDFVASGFNQLVNNAAKIRYRWGGSVPMVVRMPWGGLRHAGPYHSQNTEPWFYRTAGLKIVVPSTPVDARALMASAVADEDPVLYYEHIALYREPRIRQALADEPPAPLPLGQAALRRAGSDLAIISYGAFVHVALRVAEALAADGIEASVLDLRSLVPLDKAAVLAVARHCSKVLIIHEDSRTGGIGESLAAIIQEEAFESLDAPIRVIGALDTPVPYSPSLEEFYLPSEAEIEHAARLLVRY